RFRVIKFGLSVGFASAVFAGSRGSGPGRLVSGDPGMVNGSETGVRSSGPDGLPPAWSKHGPGEISRRPRTSGRGHGVGAPTFSTRACSQIRGLSAPATSAGQARSFQCRIV